MSGWKGFLPTHDTLGTMPIGDLDLVVSSTGDNIHTLAHGIAAIGTLLAGTATNEEMGINPDAVANVGFMLESLGALISGLVDVGDNAKHHQAQRAVKAPGKTTK